MKELKCSGTNALTGDEIELKGDTHITQMRVTSMQGKHRTSYVSPGFVDIQVNGFAGVDYNSGITPHEEIARSIQVLFSTGVSRFFPTVITGAPDAMAAALKNLMSMKED